MVALLMLGAAILASTVLSGPIASAAQSVSATITGPLDGQGNVKVHEQGTANVNVLGNVSTQGAIPATQFSRFRFLTGAPDVVSGPDPAGRNYAITSVSFGNRLDTPQEMNLFAEYGTTSDCRSFTGPLDGSDGPLATVPAHDTVSMTFPQPFVVEAKAGANSCLLAGSGLGHAEVTVVGYTF
jgi:hypothetical protein